MATRKFKHTLEELNDHEKHILSAIPDDTLDKLISIRDIRSLELLKSKEYMTEEERLHILSHNKAYTDFIETIRSLKRKETTVRDRKIAEIKASNLIV